MSGSALNGPLLTICHNSVYQSVSAIDRHYPENIGGAFSNLRTIFLFITSTFVFKSNHQTKVSLVPTRSHLDNLGCQFFFVELSTASKRHTVSSNSNYSSVKQLA